MSDQNKKTMWVSNIAEIVDTYFRSLLMAGYPETLPTWFQAVTSLTEIISGASGTEVHVRIHVLLNCVEFYTHSGSVSVNVRFPLD